MSDWRLRTPSEAVSLPASIPWDEGLPPETIEWWEEHGLDRIIVEKHGWLCNLLFTVFLWRQKKGTNQMIRKTPSVRFVTPFESTGGCPSLDLPPREGETSIERWVKGTVENFPGNEYEILKRLRHLWGLCPPPLVMGLSLTLPRISRKSGTLYE